MKTMHLFAGIGGGLLADLILGHEPIIAVEWDAYACQVLRERAEEEWFPGLQVWEGDVRLFDPSGYAGKVDCIHAGFPCQDISVAGKQAGVSEGTRSGLYREVLRIAGIVKPRLLFLENVSAILSNGLGTVLADLAAMGYDARWLCIRASDVGAPHHRDRWFALCTSYTNGSNGSAKQECEHQWTKESCGCSAGEMESHVSYADSNEWGASGVGQDAGADGWNDTSGVCEVLADTEGSRRTGHLRSKRGIQEHTKSDLVGWWEVEPGLGRVANGVPNRVGQLKGYGNAQVPLQAVAAWRLLGGE